MSNFFGKLTEHVHELRKLEASESNANRKNKDKDEKIKISLKALISKAKIEEDQDNLSDDSSKDKEMRLFVRRYNKYMMKSVLKHLDKKLMKFRKLNPPKKRVYKKKEEEK